jgi:serine/threonine protein kinase
VNDFNNAKILQWDSKHHRYCKTWLTFEERFKSPEEWRGDYCDEGVDTYALGNSIFSLLTGLYPFPGHASMYDVADKVKNGEHTRIDARYRSRSFVESRLVDVMERMLAPFTENRPSIFEVVQYLRDTKALADRINATATVSAQQADHSFKM